MSGLVQRAIDPWVNVSMLGGEEAPEWLVRVKEDYFKAGEEFLGSLELPQLIEQMDAAGVEKAILSVYAKSPQEDVLAFARERPDRFGLAAVCDPTEHMRACWALEDLAAEHPVVMARVIPFMHDLSPDHRDYYPLYAKCCDLDLPISINTGIPGPPMPGECQNPMYLDRVCLDFPKLSVCMAHGADPWWSVAIRLMLKYKRLHLMTSAYLPRYLPDELIHFMNTRGQDKILFASDHPVLSMERCISAALELDLREGVLDKYLHANAERLFFSPRKPRSVKASA
jgi:predicted TIM-barrel fold metal-dependent hydrolase